MKIPIWYPSEGYGETIEVEVWPGESQVVAIMARGRAQHEWVLDDIKRNVTVPFQPLLGKLLWRPETGFAKVSETRHYWAEKYPHSKWQSDVTNGETVLGLFDWRAHEIEVETREPEPSKRIALQIAFDTFTSGFEGEPISPTEAMNLSEGEWEDRVIVWDAMDGFLTDDVWNFIDTLANQIEAALKEWEPEA